jgi:predicted transposase YdaD
MEQGILADYLDRKSREVINMLCAKYSYKDDIAVKKQEAFEDGQMQKAVEAASNLLKMNVLSVEQIAQAAGLPLQKVLELQSQIK